MVLRKHRAGFHDSVLLRQFLFGERQIVRGAGVADLLAHQLGHPVLLLVGAGDGGVEVGRDEGHDFGMCTWLAGINSMCRGDVSCMERVIG